MRALAKLLPWTAAISLGALLGAADYSVFAADVRTAFPPALGLCVAMGTPAALWFRVSGDEMVHAPAFHPPRMEALNGELKPVRIAA